MNIILTSLRGTGKSTLGKLIAKKLNRQFIDIDVEIEKQTGKSTQEIIAAEGWQFFRKLEAQTALKISKIDNLVISTGGGTMMDKNTSAAIKKNGFVILLTADLVELKKRLEKYGNRPSLTGNTAAHEEIATIWTQRKKQYYAVADMIYDTTEDKDWLGKANKIIHTIPIPHLSVKAISSLEKI